ncbi:AAA family ATPase [Patescibacteria group bacterium]
MNTQPLLQEKVKVFGLIGGIASGKSTVQKVFADEDYQVIELSDTLKKKLKEMGIDNPKRIDYATCAETLREEFGKAALALLSVNNISEDGKVVISGIRTPEEVEYLRERFSDLVLIGIDVPLEVRIERVRSRLRSIDPMSEEAILKEIDREWNGGENGCQLGSTITLCDIFINGNTSINNMQAECRAVAFRDN